MQKAFIGLFRRIYSYYQVLEDLNCAKLITEMNYDKKIDEMHNWLQNISKKQLVELGTNGVDVIQKKYSKIVVTQQYVDLINSLIR